jgi:spermidine synthase
MSSMRRFTPLLLLLFVGSGCAALVYEVVWFQLLQLVIGSSAVSLGVLLGTFMGGMCLGSLLLPRFVSARHHPLKVYAYLELAIGFIGLIALFGMPLISGLYTAWAGTGGVGIFLRALAAGICLLPPTMAMGATLPAMSRWVKTTPEGVSWLGFFYGGNTVGAVIGSLLAGFYLLRVHDMAIATYVAVALNVLVATIALLVARVAPHEVVEEARAGKVEPVPGAWAIYVAIALSGMTALASEVIWTRLLSLLFGATAYTFSLILAVFLLGIGIGSSAGSALARNMERPRLALGWCQMLLCGAIAWAAYTLALSLPFWPIDPSLSLDPWFNFQLDLARALWVLLPGAILWGASFPLALAAVAANGQDPGRLVGGVYASNTVGAIVGALGGSLLLVTWLGSQHTQQALIISSGLSALLVLEPLPSSESARPRSAFAGTLPIVAAAVGAALLARNVPPIPKVLVAYGRYAATRATQPMEIIYMGEGWNASVAVSRLPGGVLNYHNAGKVQASSEPQDMRLQRMLGHFTTLIPKNPSRVLVIGCGAGVTAGAVSIEPRLQELTIAEIEPLVPKVVSTYFAEHNFDVIRNPKTRIHLDDARHYLLTTDETFDAITSDPLDPWVKGAAMLYTQEFFELVKSRLKPGGVVTLFVQLYESNTEAVKSEVATFMEAFPNGVVWGNTQDGRGYDMVLMGQVDPLRIDVDEMQQKLSSPEYAQVAHSLSQVGIHSAVDLFATYAGRGPEMGSWMQDAKINRDRNLRLQYLAGLGLNLYQSDRIYSDIIAHARYPEGLFSGSESTLQALREAIAREHARSLGP